MVDIVLNSNHDAIFMMAMIFIHDFLHDFSGLSGRMQKIKKEVEEFTEYLSAKSSNKGGTTPLMGREEVETNYDDDLIDPSELIYAELGPTETIPILGKWVDFLKSPGSSELFTDVSSADIQTLIDKYNLLLSGPSTRSRVRAIQIIKDAIDETKLHVYGNIYSEGITKHKTEGRSRAMSFGGRVEVHDPQNILLKTEALQTKKTELQQIVESTKATGKFYEHNGYMRAAFDKTIKYHSDDAYLANYFKFMKRLYLYYEHPDVNPYTILNNVHIENALTLYLLDTHNQVIRANNTKFILESIQLQYLSHFNSKMKGGSPTDIQEYIENDFSDIYFIIISVGGATMDEVYSLYQGHKEVIDLKGKIGNLMSVVSEDKETSEILNTTTFNSHRKQIASKFDEYNTAHKDGARTMPAKRKEFISSSINLIKYIYGAVSKHIESMNAKLNASVPSPKALSSEAKDDAKMILVTVALGGKEYILANLDKDDPNFKKNTVFVEECHIIDNVIKSGTATSKTIDNGIRDAFIKYSNKNHSYKLLNGISHIKQVIGEKKSERLKIATIDNAVKQEVFDELKIAEDDVICPTSSVCDAMGSFGSCPAKSNVNREFYPMDFKIKNRDETIYYHGRTEVKPKKSLTEVSITYDAQVNNFFLSEVEIKIDIGKKNIVVLSANQTYKTLLSTILIIWDRLFKTKSGRITTEMMWESLLSDVVFIEFVKCGSIKSVGDLFQEINSVAEFGGYDSSRIHKTDLAALKTIISNQYRIGANGDQPSGVRAGYLLLKARTGINPNSMGGYFSDSKKGTFAIRGDIPTDFSLEPDRPGSAPSKITKVPTRMPVNILPRFPFSAPPKAQTQKALPPQPPQPKKSLKPTKTSIEWTKLTIPELKEEIRRRNEQGKRITITGNKTELIERLVYDDNANIVRAANNGIVKRSYEDWMNLRLEQLKEIVRERKSEGRKINVTGNKTQLIESLMKDDVMRGGTRKLGLIISNRKTRKYH